MSENRNTEVRRYMAANVNPDKTANEIKREMVTGVIDQIQEVIPNAGRVEYTGSNYEGNATKHNSDFDVMFDIAPKGTQFTSEGTDREDVRKLKYRSGADQQYVDKFVTDEGYLSGKAVVQKQVQPAIDRLIGVQNHGGHLNVNGREVQVNRSVQGAAVTLDLKSGKHEAQIDIVPSVNAHHVVGGKEGVNYVAKPPKTGADTGTWRESYSVEEKSTFKGVDKGNQVHREVLKIAKEELSGMRSFIPKTAMSNLISKDGQRVNQGAEPKSWTVDDTADRLQDLGKEIYKGLDRGHMTHPSNRAANQLTGESESDRQKWKEAIGKDGKGLVEKATLGNQN